VSVFDRLTGGPDPAKVRDEMIALKEPERRKRAKAARVEFELFAWRGGRESPSGRWRAAALGWVGTATARTISSEFWRIGIELARQPAFADDVYAVLAARGRSFFATLARLLLRNETGWGSWPLVRRAVREGLIDPPEGDAYVRGLVEGICASLLEKRNIDSAYEGLVADPRLLEDEVWQLFEVDTGSELSNSLTWAQVEPGNVAKGWTRGDNLWIHGLTRLADEGRLDRDRLLDASLDALMRDFRASTVGWYAKLHEELEPTREERIARLDRYLALVTSPAPAVVKEGLAALREIEDAVSPEAFARVAPTPFTQRQKNLSTETLSLLARLCKQHPDGRAALLDAAAHALAHERADVQERGLKLLEQYPDDAPRASLLGYVEAVSPTLRPRVEQLTGVVAAPAPENEDAAVDLEISQPSQPEPTRAFVLETRPTLLSVESVDELIELAAALLEGQGSGDDCERFLDGVSRLCGERPDASFERRTAGLAKRAETATGWGAQALGTEIVAQLVLAWTRRRKPRTKLGPSPTILGFLARRGEDVAGRAARGVARPLLSFPTHAGGWIDPDVLEERERGFGRVLNRPDPLDRLQSRVRAFPEFAPLEYERRVVTTSVPYGPPATRELRLSCPAVPPELGELGPPVATAGATESTRATWYGSLGWAGFDALGVRWALTVLPSLPEVAFAGAAHAAAEAREGTPYGHPDTVLEFALDPHVPLRREAWLATAACLVAKSPDLPRVAVDLLVASIEDGRFDAPALGAEVAWLLDNDLAKVNRLEAPLRDTARISGLHAAQVVRTVEATLACLAGRPHGLHALLEVAVEGATATGRRIEDQRARAALEGITGDVSPSSKLGKLARTLLAD
jgi:hypothetical protein